jgi:fucose 4-O-acetylase-like acetyltransferase
MPLLLERSSSTSVSVAPATRLIWIDAARGLCVLAVVMLHFRIFVYDPLAPTTNGIIVWTQFTEFFGGFRLPLLFAISGLVVSQRVRAGWSDRRNLVRAASSYWLYVSWLGVFALLSLVFVAKDIPFRVMTIGDFFTQLVIPNTTLWYVLALALYVVVLTSLERVHPAIILGSLAAVSILTGLVPAADNQALWLHVVYYAFFFAAGVYLRPALIWCASSGLWWKSLATIGAFVFCERLWEMTEQGNMLESTARLSRDSAAVAVSIAVIALASRIPVFARAASLIGRQTLPIFILQLPVIWALIVFPPVAASLQLAPVRYLAPALGTVVIVLASLGLHRLMMRTPMRHLFRLPESWGDRILHHSPRYRNPAPAVRQEE